MSDKPFSAAPAPGVRRTSPGLAAKVLQCLEREAASGGRTHSVSFAGARTVICIAELTEDFFTIDLPTFVRGRFLATYEDFLTLETEALIQPSEISHEDS